MLRKHSATIARMNADVQIKTAVRAYFGLPEVTALTPALYQRGLGQADLVLALLRIDHGRARHYVELLIGHPITIGPSCLLSYPRNGSPRVSRTTPEQSDRKVIFVQPGNPRQPNTAAALRWSEIKVGRTVAQLRSRGITKRDIRRATRLGWIKLEESNHAE